MDKNRLTSFTALFSRLTYLYVSANYYSSSTGLHVVSAQAALTSVFFRSLLPATSRSTV